MKKDQYRKIEVVPHQPEWKNVFDREAKLIKQVMGDLIVKIHHIGSTAIPGIMAKPVIDMIPEVSDIKLVDAFNEAMHELGYQSFGEYGLVGRRFFVKHDQAGERLVNAHFYASGNPEIVQHLLFLDYMHAHPEAASEYSGLKEKLTKKFPTDIDGYCNGKDLFVKNILSKAGFNELYLRRVFTDNEWFHYHRITKTEIFDRDSNIIYDRNHPSISASNNNLYVFYRGSEIIGTLLIEHHDQHIAILRLISIDGKLQNQGYGTKLLEQAENIIKDGGYKKILLHASPKAYQFYLRNGYSKMDFSFDQSAFADSIDMGKLL